ncbi:MAG: hemophore-related protein [Mycolicibacterium mageritense]|nr:MAG: hemophore-related protein [Mycolicibacterium mageritense]
MHRMSARTVRRCLYGMCAGGVVSAAFTLPTATAAPDQCSESGINRTVSSVSASTSAYLAAHPEADQSLSDIATQAGDRADALYQAYFDQNPQVEQDLRTINQPVTDLSAQCGVDVTPTSVSAALQDL